MIEENSRYHQLETKSIERDGREIAYKERRFLPDANRMRLLVEVETGQGDRLDQITAKALGDPEQYWRICDANNTMSPLELTARPGTRLRVPVPEF